MYKKIIITLSAIIVLSLPFQQQYAESAILSKVASKGAQKIVKEVIKESAFDIAIDLFVNQAYDMALEEQAKYKAQSDYELFCGKKMPDLITCEKPMQVKKVLTSADKTNIGNQAEIELDKLITNGKGFTRWQKFLDWFLPIWVASFALTAITYAIDPEVRSLFNEAGYNALVALGLIKPVTTTEESVPKLTNVNLPLSTAEGGNPPPKTVYTTTNTNLIYNTTSLTISPSTPYITPKNYIFKTELLSINSGNYFTSMSHFLGISGERQAIFIWSNSPTGTFGLGNTIYPNAPQTVQSITYAIDGQTIGVGTLTGTTATSFNYSVPNEVNIELQKTKSYLSRIAYKIGDFYYTDVLFNTVDGKKIDVQIKATIPHTEQPSTEKIQSSNYFKVSPSGSIRLTAYLDQKITEPIILSLPEIHDATLINENAPKSTYENDQGQITLIPSSALPYTQISTGQTLEPVKDGEEMKFVTPDGTSVPEDDITIGEPNIQDTPEGKTVTPPVTQNNPNPQPIPLTPPPAPPLGTPPIETETPRFPEGESCEVGLKLPKISPLAYAVSESFPFSIPFDLYDGFQAIFSEMGNEKPEFNYKLNFMGEQQEWKISIPDYFDSWKRFTDSFIIFIFDVGIIFMIFRFMGGSK